VFLVGQFQEWFGIWAPGLLHEGLVFGSRHGEHVLRDHRLPRFHVLIGVAYILAILFGYLRAGSPNARSSCRFVLVLRRFRLGLRLLVRLLLPP